MHVALLQKHYLCQTFGTIGQGNGKITAGPEGHFLDNATSSAPLSFCCLENKLRHLLRTAVWGNTWVLHKPKIHLLKTSHGQQNQLFFPLPLRKAK